jgi:hypothetical protein
METIRDHQNQRVKVVSSAWWLQLHSFRTCQELVPFENCLFFCGIQILLAEAIVHESCSSVGVSIVTPVADCDVIGLDIIVYIPSFVKFLEGLKDMKPCLQYHDVMLGNQRLQLIHRLAKLLHNHKEKLVFTRDFLDLLGVNTIILDDNFSFTEELWNEIAFQAL